MHTTLVIGGAGFIGTHLTRRLAQAGHTVYATHRPGTKPPPLPGVRWVAADLSRPDASAVWPGRCDTVVYLAQARTWRDFPAAAADVFQVNVQALMQAVRHAEHVRAQRFIFASTGSVYTDKQRPILESDALLTHEPRSFYVACKLAGELLLGPYQAVLPVIALRLFMPYGAGQSQDMLLPRLIAKVRAGQPIQLHGADGLLANPTAASDVAETIERCLTLEHSATLNVGGPERLSLRAIGRTIGAVVGKEPIFEVVQSTSGPVLVGDTTLLRQMLGWQPATRLEDGLRQWLGRTECHADNAA